MADSLIPDFPITTAEKPRANLSGGEIAAPFRDMANALDKTGAALTDVSEEFAQRAGEEAGRKSVRTADDGSLIVDDTRNPFIVGPAAARYERAAKLTQLAQMQPKVETDLLDLRLKHQNDPAGFAAAAKGYADTTLGAISDPHIRGAIGDFINQHAEHNYRTELVETNSHNTAEALQTYQARIKDLNEQMSSLARQGGTGTPEYLALARNRATFWNELQSDPRFKFSKERADLEVNEAFSNDKVQEVIGNVQRQYQKDGDLAKAKQSLMGAFWGEGSDKLNLTAAKRDHGVAEGIKALSVLTAQDREAITENRAAITGYLHQLIIDPKNFDEGQHGNMLQRSHDIGDFKSVHELEVAKRLQPLWASLHAMSGPEQADALAQMRPGLVPSGAIGKTIEAEATRVGLPPDFLKRVAQIESSGNPNANRGRADTKYKGLFQLSPEEFQRYGGGRGAVGRENLDAADKALNLTPQEKALYERHLTNLTGPGGVNNPDGSRSTLFQLSFEQNGKIYNIPTVWDGKILKPDDAIARSRKEGIDKFPSYGSEAEAEARYDAMHKFMERDTADYLRKGDIFNARDNAAAGANALRARFDAFQQQYGRAPSVTELYLAHQQGTGGLAAHLANPDRPAWENMLSTAEGQQKGAGWAKQAIWGNVPDDVKRQFPGGVNTLTSRDFMALWQRKVERQLVPGQQIDLAADTPTTRLWQSTVKETQSLVDKNAKQAFTEIESKAKKGAAFMPGELDSFAKMAAQSGDEELVKKATPWLNAIDLNSKLPAGTSVTALEAKVAELQSQGLDSVPRQTFTNMIEMAQEANNRLHQAPLVEGANRGWIGAVDQLDTANPQAFTGEIASREKKIGVVRQNAPDMGPISALSPAEGKSLGVALTAGDPKAAGQILEGLRTSLSPENWRATMASDPVKNAVTDMARSNDPARMNAGMMTLDKLWTQNAPEFEKAYGEHTLTRLLAWKGLQALTPDMMVERLNKADDPFVAKGRAEAGKLVDDEFKGTKPADVAYELGSSWGIPLLSRLANPLTQATPAPPVDPIQAGAMEAEFKDTVKALRMYGVDPDTAKRLTVERMHAQWQPSKLIGGALMKNAPEASYPQVDGSHDWMARDLEEFVTKVYGTKIGAAGEGIIPGWSLRNVVSDAQTEQEIARGQPPSYRLHIIDKNGQDQFVRDPATGMDRWRPTPATALGEARTRFERGDQPYASIGQQRPFMMAPRQ